MARVLISIGVLLFVSGSAVAASPVDITSALVLSLPGIPSPPNQDRNAGRLFRGTWREVDPKGRPSPIDPIRALAEAALSCGQRRFNIRDLGSDHGKEMVLTNDSDARRALTCIAGKVSFDFYVRIEHSKGR
ncbi:MAG: hypothetical protein ACTHOJ_13865 [Sphingomonas oligoaromativorans]